MEKSKILLISSDGIEFNIDIEKISSSYQNPYLSKTIQNLIHDTHDKKLKIQLPMIEKDSLKSDVLEVIIQYCQKQHENAPKVIDGEMGEIIEVIKQHIEYHRNENSIEKCQFTIKPIPQTYWYNLQKIKPQILNLFKFNISEEEKEDFWVHLRRLHENGFCCHDDEKIEYNRGQGKVNYKIQKWSREILEKYAKELSHTTFEESFLTRIGLAADFLDIQYLQEDVAHLYSEFIEKRLLIFNGLENEYDLLRKFFNVNDDIPDKEKQEIKQLIEYIDIHNF
jgi:hypothetical protein